MSEQSLPVALSSTDKGKESKRKIGKGKWNKYADTPPEYFLCPITLEIMKNPIISKCGHMFDREAIMKWMKGDYEPGKTSFTRNCPVCHAPIEEQSISPCFPIKTAIEDYLAGNRPRQTTKSTISKLKEKFGFKRSSSLVNLTKKWKLDDTRKAQSYDEFGLFGSGESYCPGREFRDLTESNSTLDCPVIPVWATLKPLICFHKHIEFNREKYLIGRHNSAHFRIQLSEISSRHCIFWRRQRDDGLWEVFVEDKSTNGTFVNGKVVGNSGRKQIYPGDEISLGRKFTSSNGLPDVGSFIEWIFIGTQSILNHKDEIERAKMIPNFRDLLDMGDEELVTFGITQQTVRSAIISSATMWKHDYRFPAYRLEVQEQDLFVQSHTVESGERGIGSSVELAGENSVMLSLDNLRPGSEHDDSQRTRSRLTYQIHAQDSTPKESSSIAVDNPSSDLNSNLISQSNPHSSTDSLPRNYPGRLNIPFGTRIFKFGDLFHTPPNSSNDLLEEAALISRLAMQFPDIEPDVLSVIVSYEMAMMGHPELKLLEKLLTDKLSELVQSRLNPRVNRSAVDEGVGNAASEPLRPSLAPHISAPSLNPAVNDSEEPSFQNVNIGCQEILLSVEGTTESNFSCS